MIAHFGQKPERLRDLTEYGEVLIELSDKSRHRSENETNLE